MASKRKDAHVPEPPSPPPELVAAAEVIREWALEEQHCTPEQCKVILGCLSPAFLCSLPPPPFANRWPRHPRPHNFRFLFRRQVALVLGWRERREEGDKEGFSDAVNSVLRDDVWPDADSQASEGVGSCKEVGSCKCDSTSQRCGEEKK